MGRRSPPCPAPLACAKHVANTDRIELVVSNVDQNAHDIAYHIVEESVRFHFDLDLVDIRGIASNPQLSNVANRGGSWRTGALKTGEVVLTNQHLSNFMHAFFVQPDFDMPTILTQEHVMLLGIAQHVTISFATTIAHRIKRLGPRLDVEDSNVVWQMAVQCTFPFVRL